MIIVQLLLLYCAQSVTVSIGKDNIPIGEFCVGQPIDQDLILKVQSGHVEMQVEWILINHQVIQDWESVDNCMTQQFQKRAYIDWMYRLGSQVLYQSISWNAVLRNKMDFYDLQGYANVSQKQQSWQGRQMEIKSQDLKIYNDYFILLTLNGYQDRVVQIRVTNNKPTLLPAFKVMVNQIVYQDDKSINLKTSDKYDWLIYLQDPTRFNPVINTYIYHNTNEISLQLRQTWTDKLYIIIVVLTKNDSFKYYQVEWVHQVGQQWNNTGIDCNYSIQLNSSFQERYFCLEWSSMELNVMLPDYSYIPRSVSNCINGYQQLFYQLPQCICKNGFKSYDCSQIDDQKDALVQSYVNQLILDITNITDTQQYIRILYLLAKQYQGKDDLVIELLKNKTTQDNFYARLLLIDTLVIKSILNNQTILANNSFNILIEYSGWGNVIGLVEFSQFIFKTATTSQMESQFNNITKQYSTTLSVTQQPYRAATKCIFLSNNFAYGQIVQISKLFTAQLRPDLYTPYVNCMAFTSFFTPIRLIPVNVTMPTFAPLINIFRPTQLQCKSMKQQCRLLRLTDFVAEIDSTNQNGPYTIERSQINKTFDASQIIDAILQKQYTTILMISYLIIIHFL